jgi:ATP synthase protein I
MPEDPKDGAEIAAFATRLDQLAGAVGSKPLSAQRAKPNSALGIALRLSTELVLGLVVGGALGWVVDRWLGSGPWLMIVFLLCGMAAGMKNVVMTAQSMNAKAAEEAGVTEGQAESGPGLGPNGPDQTVKY